MKKLTCSLVYIFFAICAFSQANLNDGLVAFYPFNGNVNDSTNFANHALKVNGAELTTDRYNNPKSAYYFDGFDDYIEIKNVEQISFNGTDRFAISMWIKAPEKQNTTGGSWILSKWNGATQLNFPYGLVLASHLSIREGLLYFKNFAGFNDNFSKEGLEVLSTSILNDSKWHHIVIQLTDEELLQIYIDGRAEGNVIYPFDKQLDNDLNVFVGINNPNAAPASLRPFTGCVDELRFYNRPLNIDEIKLLALNDSSEIVFDTLYIELYDTIYINDTLKFTDTLNVIKVDTVFTVDTLSVMDTVTVYDTIQVEKPVKLIVSEVVITGLHEELHYYGLKVYPNPATKFIFIELDKVEIENLSIYNLTGKVLISESVNDKRAKIDIDALEGPGIYIFTIETLFKTLKLKVIIE